MIRSNDENNIGEVKVDKLIDGVRHFQSEVFGKHHDLFKDLAKGQSPETLFITCSDSRIDPNLITSTIPGELFVLRNAGNIVPPHGSSNGGEEATIEYAVAVLGVKNIIICGHSDCGAMKGLLHPDDITEFPNVQKWLTHAEATWRIMAESHHSEECAGSKLASTVEENVLVQLDNLRTIPAVSARLARGDLQLHGWVYVIETGEIYSYQSSIGKFMPLVPSIDSTFGLDVPSTMAAND